MLRWGSVVGLGMLVGCAQLLGIDELSGDGPGDAGNPPTDPDGGAPGGACAIGNGGCDPNADCTEDAGAPVCECRRGFVGDGQTCVVPWELVTTIPGYDVYNGFGAFAVGSGTRLYFFPEDNPSSFFASYDLETRVLEQELMPPAEANDFCACGLGQILVPLDSYLYQFGNFGQRYNTLLRVWEAVAYSPEVARGEAAGATLGGRIYTFGGRDALRSVQAFDVVMNVWVALGNTLPWDLLRGAAAAVEPNQIYVFGGSVDGLRNDQAAVYDTSKALWTLLPDMPESLGSMQGAGIAFGRPFAVGGNTLFYFDPSDQTWDQLALPEGNYWYAANVGADVYIVGDVADEVVIHRLATLGE